MLCGTTDGENLCLVITAKKKVNSSHDLNRSYLGIGKQYIQLMFHRISSPDYLFKREYKAID